MAQRKILGYEAKEYLLGVQHLLAMFGATVLVPLITGFSPAVALFLVEPEPMRIANSSALLNASAPSRSSFSLGMSASSQSFIDSFIQPII